MKMPLLLLLILFFISSPWGHALDSSSTVAVKGQDDSLICLPPFIDEKGNTPGPETPGIPMPDVRNLELAKAAALLQRAGLASWKISAVPSQARAGTVIDQKPHAGTMVSKEEITLFISRPVTIPRRLDTGSKAPLPRGPSPNTVHLMWCIFFFCQAAVLYGIIYLWPRIRELLGISRGEKAQVMILSRKKVLSPRSSRQKKAHQAPAQNQPEEKARDQGVEPPDIKES
ncbi:MAG: PASTA domain-containing protein [Candidatus Eremiobacteraeota bacterium]|nr:PASTA domain-containing protein [Candidatus Eremiobacteraeota bacterium]